MKEIANAANVSQHETTPVIRFFLSIWNFDWRNLFHKTHQMSCGFIAGSYKFFGGVEYLILRYVRVFVSVVALYGF